jgi:hypothetical protein
MSAQPLAFALPHGAFRHLAGADIRTVSVEEFGPAGLRLVIERQPSTLGSLIVTQAPVDGIEWLHASISWADRVPTYDELALLHRVVFGRRRWAYQVFAPASEHVNIHEHALHLFGRADGTPALPDFTYGTGSI